MQASAAAAAFEVCCRAEVAELKPGNVSRFSGGHGMRAAQFERAAAAAAPRLAAPEAELGERVLAAVRAARAAAGCNTSLGIVLLAAPLMQAAAGPVALPLRERVGRVLAAAGAGDTERICAAIAEAAPGGLGASERHDVRAPVRAPLGEVMALAAGRDLVARQYCNGFEDVFARSLGWWRALAGGPFDVVRLYLRIGGHWPDSHVARKYGEARAERVRRRLRAVEKQLDACENLRSASAVLYEADADLKRGGVNPGTSADLTVATLLADQLDQRSGHTHAGAEQRLLARICL